MQHRFLLRPISSGVTNLGSLNWYITFLRWTLSQNINSIKTNKSHLQVQHSYALQPPLPFQSLQQPLLHSPRNHEWRKTFRLRRRVKNFAKLTSRFRKFIFIKRDSNASNWPIRTLRVVNAFQPLSVINFNSLVSRV